MRYFGGLGAGKGWNSFHFILTPDEFPKVFDGLQYSFVETGTRVESDYKETSKENYFRAYKYFFEILLTGQQPLGNREPWAIESAVRESIINDIAKISFREITDNWGKPIPYKLVEPSEPVINISPFYLLFLGEKKESLTIASDNKEGVIGLQLSYPKFVTWFNTENPELMETNSYDTYTLYGILVERIKKNTRKAKIQSPVKLFKPNFWISRDAVSLINKNKYLKKNGAEIQ